MTVGAPSVAEVTARLIATIEPDERSSFQQELSKFVRWFGPNQPIDSLDVRSLEIYQDQVALSGANQSKRLSPLRAFLAYCQREGHVSGNLAKFVRLKRSSARQKDGKSETILEAETTQLTAEGHAKLKNELERLINVERPKVTQELWEARQDKDIRENAPYDAAKQHQALVEARIRELERTLAVVTIIETGTNGDRINVGSKIVLRDLKHDEECIYTLVGPQEANPRDGKISIVSPVGKALLDRVAGDVIEVEAPLGTISYRVERIGR